MDVFYQFGELMNLDLCDEKVQKAALFSVSFF